MDPDKIYADLSARIADLRVMSDLGLNGYEGIDLIDAMVEACDAFEAMTYWLARGGSLPREWQQAGQGFAPSRVDTDNPKM